MTNHPKKITIIGAGMGGALMAILLAKRGYEVDIYERRPDMRQEPVERGRSINMTLAERGLRALEEAGVREQVLAETIPLRGRMVHNLDGSKTYQPYGKNDREVIYSILRNRLNTILMTCAEALPNVNLHFNKRCAHVDKATGVLHLYDEKTREAVALETEVIIGADGAFSTVRQQMHKGVRAHYRQDFLDWGYKELTIPPGPEGCLQMEGDVLHIWPRGDYMLLAMPNRDGSFTCTCILPFEGEWSFESLKTEEQVAALFRELFPDAVPLISDLPHAFLTNPTVEMITTHTFPWYFKDRIVLVGDACHAVVPFYGQGMNAAFEDCTVLARCLEEGDDLEATFARYQQLRKRNTDVLAELSQQNFVELRRKVRSPLFVARKKLDVALNRLFPRLWLPLYTMMAHTTIPYAEARARYEQRVRFARWLGFDLVLLLLAAGMVVGGLVRSSLQGMSRWGEWLQPLKRLPFAPQADSNQQD